MHEGSRKAIIAAFAANLGIAIAKFFGFLITSSTSMLAESLHSLADTGNQGLLFFGGSRAKREATTEHQMGYGRERFFWAFIVALVLFSMGGLFALYEGIQKLRHPHQVESPIVGVVILLIALGLESFSLRTAVKETAHVKPPEMGYWSFIHTSKAPELPVVLLEDTGALIGLVFALTGLLLAWATGNARFDALGSIAIGALLVVIAMVLAREMKGLLIGESASPEVQQRIIDALTGGDTVNRLISLRTEHIGPDQLFVGAKIEFAPNLDTSGVAKAINDAEERVRSSVPEARIMYLEPDLHDPTRA